MAQIDFTESDFSKCKYNLFEVEQPFKKYPELKVMYAEVSAMCSDNEWMQWITPEQLIKFIVFCYHRQSPFINRIAELRERKTQALLSAGIEIDKLQINKEAKKMLANILLSRHEFTSRLALHFLRNENNVLWNQYLHLSDVLEDAEWEMLNSNEGDGKKMNSVEVAEKKSKVYAGIQKYRADLNIISEKLMMQDSEMQSFMSSQLIQIKRMRLITPEDYVKLSEEELTEIFKQQAIPA